MNHQLKKQLDSWQIDYESIVGSGFRHFYCPILHTDEDTLLQKGHVINDAFGGSNKSWVVQRRDVDNWFGSHFEADFVKLKDAYRLSLFEILSDPKNARKFAYQFLYNDNPVLFKTGSTPMPPTFTPVMMETDGDHPPFVIGLKMTPEELSTTKEERWEIKSGLDLQIPAIVSLIKAAHLSVFKMLGYRYALRPAGVHVGREILGRFYLDNFEKSHKEIRNNAYTYFREFRHMVRPVEQSSINLAGSITDRTFFACMGSSDRMWGLIVFEKTAMLTHAVLLPIFDEIESIETYLGFLKNENETIHVTTARYEPAQNAWHVNPNRQQMSWTKSGIGYPDGGW